MKKKHKITLLVIGILLALSLMLSSSYALWVFNVSQESTNVVISDCFELSFTEGSNAINLNNTFPMKDNMVSRLDSYDFSVTNICNHTSNVVLYLDVLDSSTIDPNYIKYKINGGTPENFRGDSYGAELGEGVIAKQAVTGFFLKPSETRNFSLKMWIADDSDSGEVENGIINARVSAEAILYKKDYYEGTLISGKEFNKAMARLVYSNSEEVDANFNDNYYSVNGFDSEYNLDAIRRIFFESVSPWDDTEVNIEEELDLANHDYEVVSTSDSDKPIYMVYNENQGSIFIYTGNNIIFSNEDSSFMFFNMNNLEVNNFVGVDTSKTTNMSFMFASKNNTAQLNVNRLMDTLDVTNMSYMFYGSGIIDLDCIDFDTQNVTNMRGMFANNSDLNNLNLDFFDTRNVTDMSSMFMESGLYELDLSSFNTSKVINMSSMFKELKKLEKLEISSFDTSNVENFGYMFDGVGSCFGCSISDIDISNFDLSSATIIEGMFANIKAEHMNFGSFNAPNVTSMSHLFDNIMCYYTDIIDFNTSNVTDMSYMFRNSRLKFDFTMLDTSNVTDMSYMFQKSRYSTVFDLSSFDASKVVKMDYMFGVEDDRCEIKEIYVGDKWNTSNVTSSTNMFKNCYVIYGQNGTRYNSDHIDKEYARVDGVNGLSGYLWDIANKVNNSSGASI